MLNMLLTTSTTATEGGSGNLSFLISFVAIIAVFYFLLIRPESKRKKNMQKMLSELVVGDEVTTIGGIIGKVVSIREDEITLETGADKVRVRFLRSAIATKRQPDKE